MIATNSYIVQCSMDNMSWTGRVFDYINFNYCIGCKLKFLKPIARCSKCGHALRTKPRSGTRLKAFRQKLELLKQKENVITNVNL